MVIALLLAAGIAVWPPNHAAGGVRTRRLPTIRTDTWSAYVTGAGSPAGAGGSAGAQGTARARGLAGARDRWVTPTRSVAAVGVLVLSGTFIFGGAASAVPAVALGATGWVLVRRARARHHRRAALQDILAALRMLARELHAGADPAVAATNTSATAAGDGALVLAEFVLAIQARDRSDSHDAPTAPTLPAPAVTLGRRMVDRHRRGRSAAADEPRELSVARLHSGWILTRRHGIAFTPLIDGLVAELAEQVVADSRRAGEVAGPVMSGYVMALLPLLGLLLGAGMGADPLTVLLGTSVGNVLLAAGALLTCAGLLWSARIVAR